VCVCVCVCACVRACVRVCVCVCIEVYKYLHNKAPGHSANPRSAVPGRRHLRSAGRGELDSSVSIWPCTGDGRLSPTVLHPGTLCLTVSRTSTLFCKPSNAIWRPSSFRHTSTLSAFEVFFYKNALYKSTVVVVVQYRLLFKGRKCVLNLKRQTCNLAGDDSAQAIVHLS